MRVIVRNCKIYRDQGVIENCYLIFDDGFITEMGIEHNMKQNFDEKYDARGRLLLPGIIDAHTHLRDQELRYKEDFLTGTSSAVLGGVTTLIDMPNNVPPTDSPQRLKDRMKCAKGKILANVGFACYPSTELGVNRRMIEEGAIAFKIFTYNFMSGDRIERTSLGRVLKAIAPLKKRLMVHCGPKITYDLVLSSLRSKKYFKLCKLEVQAVKQVISLASMYKPLLHICHISCPSTLKLLKSLKRMLNITCEVTVHHMLLTKKVIEKRGVIAHVDPPLKGLKSSKELLRLFASCDVDIVVSDHAPHALEEKICKYPKPGFPNLQLMMPLLLTQVNKGLFTLSTLLDKASARPAKIFGISKRGLIEVGFRADVVEVDLKRKIKVRSDMLVSKGKYTPFEGMTLQGFPMRTFVNGMCVVDEGFVVGKGHEGAILRGPVESVVSNG